MATMRGEMLSVTWGETGAGPERRSIILLRKDRPGHTSLQARLRRPKRDCLSLSWQTFQSPQLSSKALQLLYVPVIRPEDYAIRYVYSIRHAGGGGGGLIIQSAQCKQH